MGLILGFCVGAAVGFWEMGDLVGRELVGVLEGYPVGLLVVGNKVKMVGFRVGKGRSPGDRVGEE